MYVMKNSAGNVIQNAYTEREKENLEALGYKVVSSDGESVEEQAKALDDEAIDETVDETTAPANTDDDDKVDFDKMKIDELKAYAIEHNIEIKATLKKDIIAEIVSAEENAQQLD